MTLQFKKPMLACPLLDTDIEHTDDNILNAMRQLRFPVLASLKLDGVRALRLGGSLLSRTLKPIPNKSIRQRSLVLPGGFDMELWCPTLEYNDIQSIVMSHEHPDSDKIEFHVIDWYDPNQPYSTRFSRIQTRIDEMKDPAFPIESSVYCSAESLLEYFLYVEQHKGEGICFRLFNGPYKFGRSTLKEQYLVKLCRYITDEAIILGFVEQMENGNLTKRNRTGMMDRSHSIRNLVPKDTLGALLVKNTKGQEFSIGTGFTDAQRKHIWKNQDKYLGKTVVYRCKGHGVKVLPRCPSFKGFRNTTIDL